jgi:fermentation-respiration switch protein FrsA (DUF1100 family)
MARIIVSRPMMLLWDAITRVHFDTEAKVRTLDLPVHVVHGERDLLIPERMGQSVHAAARVQGAALWVAGAGHNDVDDVGGEPYWRWLESALGVAGGAGQRAASPRP